MAATTRMFDAHRAAGADRQHLALLQTRSSAACDGGGRSPISSRKSVPRSALRTRPSAVLGGAREGALRVTEELALDQRVGQRAAVDRDEGAVAPDSAWTARASSSLPVPLSPLDQHRRPARARPGPGSPSERTSAGAKREQPGRRDRASAASQSRGTSPRARPAARGTGRRCGPSRTVAVVEHGALVALAVDDGAVLGAGVLDHRPMSRTRRACTCDMRESGTPTVSTWRPSVTERSAERSGPRPTTTVSIPSSENRAESASGREHSRARNRCGARRAGASACPPRWRVTVVSALTGPR